MKATAAGLTTLTVLAGCIGCAIIELPAEPTTPTSLRITATQAPAPSPPDVGRVDQNDPTAVSKAAVALMWSYDADTDARLGQRAAYLRASGYFTPAYREYILTSMRATPLPADLIAHRARSHTRLTPAPYDDAEPDTWQSSSRTWRVTVSAVGRDGWHGEPVTVHVYVHLTRPEPSKPWRIDSVSAYSAS